MNDQQKATEARREAHRRWMERYGSTSREQTTEALGLALWAREVGAEHDAAFEASVLKSNTTEGATQ